MQKITPFLWFDDNAEDAVNYYVTIFSGNQNRTAGESRVGAVTRYDEAGSKAAGRPEGTAMTVPFTLNGQDFVALNGGPIFKFTEAISFVVDCENQEEVDYFWKKLSEGGDPKAQQCGWLKDKYGLSWQIVPKQLGELLGNPDPDKAKKAMGAMLEMKKLDINALKQASEA